MTKQNNYAKNRQKIRNKDCKMFNNNENNGTTLRRQFAATKPVVIAHSEAVAIKSVELANAYFNGDVLKYEGKVVSAVKEAVNVRTPSKTAMYVVEKGGFSKIAEGVNEAVKTDENKISRMNTNLDVKALQNIAMTR